MFDKESSISVTFKDVAGLDGAKQELEEIVEFLKTTREVYRIGRKNTQRCVTGRPSWHW
jgi:ATP-dependent Zn proteases